MNTYVTGSILWSSRLHRRLVRHHLPLLLLSTIVTALLYVTYSAKAAPEIKTFSNNSGQPAGRVERRGVPQTTPDARNERTAPDNRHEQPGLESQSPSDQNSAPVVRRISQTSPVLDALSVATGYTSLALVAATLLLGPLRLRRHRRTPVSTDLRRDIGIWAALVGMLHVVVGLQVHTQGAPSILANFVSEAGTPLLTSFGWANYVGLAATLILLLLAGLSNDALLKRLGVKRWKRLQRLNYLLFFLIMVHSILYEIYHTKNLVYLVLLTVLGIAVMVGQAVGVRLHVARSTAGQLRDGAA